MQGVGFRPFVYRLAVRHGVAGFVVNDTSGVVIEVEGPRLALDAFVRDLSLELPPLALIEDVNSLDVPTIGVAGFEIRRSASSAGAPAVIPADVGPCADCVRELADPNNRRFRHAFINCTNCGPRFTIIRGLPYDRAATTMDTFPMCDDCRVEYEDPADRRFHAEPICCPDCGPSLRFTVTEMHDLNINIAGHAAVTAAVAALLDGKIVAVKGVGGYHLAVRADDEAAVIRLRVRKQREEKPFAVLVADIASARRLAEVDDVEMRALLSVERPIVLVTGRAEAFLARSVAPDSAVVGIMLPPSPLHLLLAQGAAVPIVLTSGNTTDEPIAINDADARTRLGSIADAFLTHDRSILRRAEDSVVAISDARAMLWRRARGFAPRPIRLAGDGPTVLAVGAELKSTICVTRGADAFVSPHLGDLEHLAAYDAFRQMVDSFTALLGVRPEVVVHDLHPRYLSTAFAAGLEQTGVRLIGVQHHHAHIAACLAEHQLSGPVIGVAFDGIGYGSDGALWGGEFLVADLDGFERAGYLAPVPLPGGTAAVRQPWRMALAHLEAAFGTNMPLDLAVVARNAHRWEAVSEVARQPTLSPSTHGVGRLFDAVASLVGLRDEASFEGQAAIMLEQFTARAMSAEPYAFAIVEMGTTVTLDPAPAIRAIVADLRRGRDRAEIAAGFHMGLADATVAAVVAIARTRPELDTVALTGGVFQNRLLLQRCRAELRDRGFKVIVPSQIPAGDGGISLGQAAIGRRAG